MKSRYASFLIRFWQLGALRQRVTVSHIQSGEQASPESLPAAFAWIVDRTAKASSDGDSTGDPNAASAPERAPPEDGGSPPSGATK